MSATPANPGSRPVTVVVPVYGDLPGVLACIESLTRTIDESVHSVLIVNDCGPHADEIEHAILSAIAGRPSFRYERNSRNLGFVGTCNRAATELDTTGNDILLLNSDTVTTPGFVEELTDVLHSSPAHGIVCGRSNNATIASLPYRLRDAGTARTPERTAEVHAALAGLLPRFSVAPVAMGFCFLVRRELIQRFGLFDEIFAPGYGEENDFCLRMRGEGYLSLIAHRALVFHAVGMSFEPVRRSRLRAEHERILAQRHPGYSEAVQRYLRIEADPVDVFADVLAPRDATVRILVDCDGRPGAGEQKLLAAADQAADRRVTVSVPARFRRVTARRYPNLDVISHDGAHAVWDLSVGLDPEPSTTQSFRLVGSSPRAARLGRTLSVNGADAGRTLTDGRNWSELSGDELLAALNEVARTPVDIARLQDSWSRNGQRLAASGARLVARPRIRTRALGMAERVAPRAVAVARGARARVRS